MELLLHVHRHTAPVHCALEMLHTLSHCPETLRRGTFAAHCHTAREQWAVELLLNTATLPLWSGWWKSCCTPTHCLWRIGQWDSCNPSPDYPGAVGTGTRVVDCCIAEAQGAMGLVQYTTAMLGGIAWWISWAPLHWGTGAHAIRAALLVGNGQWNCCCTLPHCLGDSWH